MHKQRPYKAAAVQGKDFIVVTCEHASNAVPAAFRKYFKSAAAKAALKTHRGYDIGALRVYRRLVSHLHPDFCSEGTFTRLLADLNRSLGNKNFFSEFTRDATTADKERIAALWHGHRDPIQEFVAQVLRHPKSAAAKTGKTRVIHIAIHSFTPILNGETRNTEIGLLYDPKRPAERTFVQNLRSQILRAFQDRTPQKPRVRFNYPYTGYSDGITTSLRKEFGEKYLGIEVEINQKLFK